MHLKSVAAAAAIALALGTLSASSAGISLTPGWYSGTSLITSATGICPVAAGEFNIETVFNPGADKTGYVTRTAANYTDGSNNHWVGFSIYTFNPKSPKAGVTTWSGSGTYQTFLSENGTPVSTTNGSFTFSETWTYVDTHTYYKVGSSVFGGGPFACTLYYQKTRSFSGIN